MKKHSFDIFHNIVITFCPNNRKETDAICERDLCRYGIDSMIWYPKRQQKAKKKKKNETSQNVVNTLYKHGNLVFGAPMLF